MNYLVKIFTSIKTSSSWLGGVFAFFLPVVNAMNILLILVIVDLITGVCASKKEGHIITSNCLRRTTTKILAYFSAVLVCHCIDVILGGMFGEFTFLKVSAGIIAMTEAISVSENLYRITKLDAFYVLTQFSLKKFISLFGIGAKKDGQEGTN